MANKTYETMFLLGAKMHGSFGKTFGNVQKQLSATQRQAVLTQKAFGGISGGLLKAAGGIGILAGFKALGQGMIENASQMQDYRTTLNVVMRDQKQAAKTMAWAARYANATPFETNEVVEATVKLQAYGLAATKILPAVGDMAAVMKKSIIQATEAVADAQTGELERLKEFGITKKMIINQGKQLRMAAFVNNKGQITDQEKFNKALFDLMSKRFANGTRDQAKNWNGVMSTIKGVWSTSLAKMAGVAEDGKIKQGSFFDVLSKKALYFSDVLVKFSNSGQLEKISSSLGTMLTKSIQFAKTVNQNWGTIKPIIEALTVAYVANKGALLALIAAQKVGMLIKGMETAYLGLAIAVDMVRKGQTLLTAAQWLLNAAMTANPIGLVVAGVAALGVGAYYLIKNWAKVKTFFAGLWDWLKKSFADIMLTVFFPWIGIPKLLVQNWGKIKGLFGGGKKVATKTPKYAAGTSNHQGGWAVVGERGRELVNLPRGSRVVPNNRTENLLSGLSGGGKGINITFAPVIDARGNANPEAIGRAVSQSYDEFKRNMGQFMRQNERLNFARG